MDEPVDDGENVEDVHSIHGPSSSSSSAGKSGHEASEDESIDPGVPDDGYPAFINGSALVREDPDGHAGFRLACCLASHRLHDCRKNRSRVKDTDAFGRLAPVYYLQCWHDRAKDMDWKAHNAYRPTKADVQAFLDKGSG